MNNVDKFLLSHKTEVADDGFSDRVMQSLPANMDWQRRMSRIWNGIFIVLLVVCCWQTDVLSNFIVDVEVFIKTLPLHFSDINIWYVLGCVLVGMYGIIYAAGKNFIVND